MILNYTFQPIKMSFKSVTQLKHVLRISTRHLNFDREMPKNPAKAKKGKDAEAERQRLKDLAEEAERKRVQDEQNEGMQLQTFYFVTCANFMCYKPNQQKF